MTHKYSEIEIAVAKEEKERINKLRETYKKERENFQAEYDLYSKTEMDFQKKLTIILEQREKTAEELAEDVGIEPETLSRYRNGNGPSFEVLVAICIALELDIKQSAALFSSLGYSFLGTSKEHYAYAYLIEKHSGEKISKCNEILTGLGIDIDDQLYPHRHTEKMTIKKRQKVLEYLEKTHK